MSRVVAAHLFIAFLTALLATLGCKTESYCFENCDPFVAAGGNAASSGYQGGAGGDFGITGGSGGGVCVGFDCPPVTDGGGSDCVMTNGGVEVCDQQDNDCDGQTDEPATIDADGNAEQDGIDFRAPQNCGDCTLDCTDTLTRVATPTCTPSAALGQEPGTCDYDQCAIDWFDADGNRENGCEYYCQWNPDRTNDSDPGGAEGCGRDDDCDGATDEDVDVCSDVENCGECGKRCSLPNATATCTSTATGAECSTMNTRCVVSACDTNYHDVDGSADNGCEYECTPTNGGVETCDGEDNDCDGLIDNADPDLENDPAVGASCQGSDKGACADPSVAGVQKCIGGAISCCDVDSNTKDAPVDSALPNASIRNGICRGTAAPLVLFPDDNPELCNGIDDDCDGVTDDSATDAGGICGSNVGVCQSGIEQCVNGALTCVGNVGPTTDNCDGLDNNCDGVIDGIRVSGGGQVCNSSADCTGQGLNSACLPVFTNNNQPECVAPAEDIVDSGGAPLACDVPPTPPQNVSQPCSPGTLSCFGGVPTCVGSVKAAPGTIDACGEDTNCDGVLTNQAGRTDNDVQNCGSCGNDCNNAVGNGNWTCSGGNCVRSGCDAGYVECGGILTDDCETQCSPDPGGEQCDGVDNDCDCQTDEGIPTPTVFQACGVSPSATDPNCTDPNNVTILCTNGGWVCSFPNGYCPGGDCSSAVEYCDGGDNDCDGEIDENYLPPFMTSGFLGDTCNSDDGLPPPGHGDCQTTGVYVCAPGPNSLATQCAATKDDSRATPELCDGVDNDCDGLVDGADPDMATADGRLGDPCNGGTMGICADVSTQGTTQCDTGAVVCAGNQVVVPGQLQETCNNVDDDCDGSTDEVADLIDDGAPCGTSVGACTLGNEVCVSGNLECQGDVGPATGETCNGIDDDCDGLTDEAADLTDLGPCGPPGPPPGATSPCSPGTEVCTNGAKVCSGATWPTELVDSCGVDANCDGQLTDQPPTDSDPKNCGACGYDCAVENATKHGTWDCQNSVCVRIDCEFGWVDCDNDPVADDCEYQCTPLSGQEVCNGIDDDCDCSTDVGIAVTPSAVSVCDIAPGATQPECQEGPGGVTVSCDNGSWTCAYQPGFCTATDPVTGQPSCALTADVCNGADDNCNGATDETFKAPVRTTKILGNTCTSEDVYRDLQCSTSGDPNCPPTAPPQGVCVGTGTYICDGLNDTICTAVFDEGARTDEACDGKDNDCDGLIDEPFDNVGGDPRFVAPAVVQLGPSLWMYQYEASRPKANANNPGNGNGYWCTGAGCTSGVPPAPSGTPLQKTPACSVAGVMPWFNVTPVEVEQTCDAMGGFVCDQAVWNAACEVDTNNCTYAYGPLADCDLASAPPARVCNIHAFDFDGNGANGITDGLLPTASGLLADCYADWDNLYSNAADGDIFDLMGNLREITRVDSTTYALMGGAFNTTDEGGGACDFDFFAVTPSFQLFDTGFRCCFDSDPRIAVP